MDLGPYYGYLLTCLSLAIPLSIVAILIVGYWGSPLIIWSVVLLGLGYGYGLPIEGLIALAAVLLVFLIKPIRTMLITSVVM